MEGNNRSPRVMIGGFCHFVQITVCTSHTNKVVPDPHSHQYVSRMSMNSDSSPPAHTLKGTGLSVVTTRGCRVEDPPLGLMGP